MKTKLNEPNERISPRAVSMWRVSRTIGHAVFLLLLAVLTGMDMAWNWWDWVGWVLYSLIGLAAVSGILFIAIEPTMLQRTWRYNVSEEYVQLKHGVLTRVHVLVPMTKVEYVTTDQGPIMRKYGLYNVTVGTMASSHVIPALPKTEAFALHEQIARLAQVKDGE